MRLTLVDGVPFDDGADRGQRAYARFKAWHHEQQVACAEELRRQGKEPPLPSDPPDEDEEDSELGEQDSLHYWSRYPPE